MESKHSDRKHNGRTLRARLPDGYVRQVAASIRGGETAVQRNVSGDARTDGLPFRHTGNFGDIQ